MIVIGISKNAIIFLGVKILIDKSEGLTDTLVTC